MTVRELQVQLQTYPPDMPITLVAVDLDAIVRAARRCQEDVIRLTPRPVHDGTRCVLVPEGLWERLEQALALRAERGQLD